MSDAAEGQRIGTAEYRQQLGIAIAQGVQSYNTAVNFRAPDTTFARAGENPPPHTRSISEPLPPAVAPTPAAEAPRVPLHDGE